MAPKKTKKVAKAHKRASTPPADDAPPESSLPQHPVPVANNTWYVAVDVYAQATDDVGPVFQPQACLPAKFVYSATELRMLTNVDEQRPIAGVLHQSKTSFDCIYFLWLDGADQPHHILLDGKTVKEARSDLCLACGNPHPGGETWLHNDVDADDVPVLLAEETEPPAKNEAARTLSVGTLASYVSSTQLMTAAEIDAQIHEYTEVCEGNDDWEEVEKRKQYFFEKLLHSFVSPATTCCVTKSKKSSNFDVVQKAFSSHQQSATTAAIKILHRHQQRGKTDFAKTCLNDMLNQVIAAHKINRIRVPAGQQAKSVQKLRCSQRLWAIMRCMSSYQLVRKDVVLLDIAELIASPYVVANRKMNNFRGNSGNLVKKAEGATDPDDDHNDDDADGDDDDFPPTPSRGHASQGSSPHRKRGREDGFDDDENQDKDSQPRKKNTANGTRQPQFQAANMRQDISNSTPRFASMHHGGNPIIPSIGSAALSHGDVIRMTGRSETNVATHPGPTIHNHVFGPTQSQGAVRV